MLTIDANVWVAAFDPHDRFHDTSVAFLRTVTQQSLRLHGPAYLVVEVACALARRAQNSEAGELAIDQLREHPSLNLLPMTNDLLVPLAYAVAGAPRRCQRANAMPSTE